MNNFYLQCIKFILLFFLFPLNSQAQDNQNLIIRTVEMKLVADTAYYKLQIKEHDQIRCLPIPVHWLIPEEEEEYGYVSPYNYDEAVTVFRISGEYTGVHISSYGIQKEGSAQAAAGRDVFLVYAAKENKVYPGFINLGITKDRVRSAGTFYATNSHFMLGDINRDGFNDIGIKKEELELSPHRQSLSMHPVEWYVYEQNSWSHRPDSSGRFPTHKLIRLPLIGLGKSPVDYVKEMYLQKNVCRLKYEDFGVQAMAYELIGYQWYQWDTCGNPDPDSRYDIEVVVYKGIPTGMVREFYPVYKEFEQDYRYVEYYHALRYLNRHIREIEELLQVESPPGDSSLFANLKSTLLKTRNKIISRLND